MVVVAVGWVLDGGCGGWWEGVCMVVAVAVVVVVCVNGLDVGVFELGVWAGHGAGGGVGERLRGIVVVGGCGGGRLEGDLGGC